MVKFMAPGISSKSKLVRQFEFSKNLEDFYETVLGSKTFLSKNVSHTNLLILSKLQTVIKSHSLMTGAWFESLKLGHIDIFDMLLHFRRFLSYSL